MATTKMPIAVSGVFRLVIPAIMHLPVRAVLLAISTTELAPIVAPLAGIRIWVVLSAECVTIPAQNAVRLDTVQNVQSDIA